jgi:hypothetical protein
LKNNKGRQKIVERIFLLCDLLAKLPTTADEAAACRSLGVIYVRLEDKEFKKENPLRSQKHCGKIN